MRLNILLALVVVFTLVGVGRSASAQQSPRTVTEIKHDLSAPLSTVVPVRQSGPAPVPRPTKPSAAGKSPAAILNFDGIAATTWAVPCCTGW